MALALAGGIAPEMLQLTGLLPDWIEDESDVLPLTPTQPLEAIEFAPEPESAEPQQGSCSSKPKRPLAPYSQREIYEKKSQSSRRTPASSGRRSVTRTAPDSNTPGTGTGSRVHATSTSCVSQTTAMSPSECASTSRRSASTARGHPKVTSTSTANAGVSSTATRTTTPRGTPRGTSARDNTNRQSREQQVNPYPSPANAQQVPHHMMPTKAAAARHPPSSRAFGPGASNVRPPAVVTASELTGAAAASPSSRTDKPSRVRSSRTTATTAPAQAPTSQQPETQPQSQQQPQQEAPKQSKPRVKPLRLQQQQQSADPAKSSRPAFNTLSALSPRLASSLQQQQQEPLPAHKSPGKSSGKTAAIFVRPSTSPHESCGGAAEDDSNNGTTSTAAAPKVGDGDSNNASSCGGAAPATAIVPVLPFLPEASNAGAVPAPSPRQPHQHPSKPQLPAIKSKASATPKKAAASAAAAAGASTPMRAAASKKGGDNNAASSAADEGNDCSAMRDARPESSSRCVPAPLDGGLQLQTAAAGGSACERAAEVEVAPEATDGSGCGGGAEPAAVVGGAGGGSCSMGVVGSTLSRPDEEVSAATAWRSMDEGKPVKRGCGCVVM